MTSLTNVRAAWARQGYTSEQRVAVFCVQWVSDEMRSRCIDPEDEEEYGAIWQDCLGKCLAETKERGAEVTSVRVFLKSWEKRSWNEPFIFGLHP